MAKCKRCKTPFTKRSFAGSEFFGCVTCHAFLFEPLPKEWLEPRIGSLLQEGPIIPSRFAKEKKIGELQGKAEIGIKETPEGEQYASPLPKITAVGFSKPIRIAGISRGKTK